MDSMLPNIGKGIGPIIIIIEELRNKKPLFIPILAYTYYLTWYR